MAVLSNWSTLVEGLSTSSQDAYLELQGALAAREVPEIEFSRVVYAESGVGSAKREYLRIQRKDLVFDVCAAPFGKSFFFSWWMAIPPLPFAPLWTAAFFFLVLLGTVIVQYPFGDSCLGYIVLGLAPFALTLLYMTLMKVGVVLNEATLYESRSSAGFTGSSLRRRRISRLIRRSCSNVLFISPSLRSLKERSLSKD